MGSCQVRFIEVPDELHRRFAHADALALYQMIARTSGSAARADKFVLATNIDILFSSELAAFISERRLQPGRMYRIDRHDVMSDVPVDAPPEEQLAYCRKHLIRVNVREGTYNVSPDGRPILSPGDIARRRFRHPLRKRLAPHGALHRAGAFSLGRTKRRAAFGQAAAYPSPACWSTSNLAREPATRRSISK